MLIKCCLRKAAPGVSAPAIFILFAVVFLGAPSGALGEAMANEIAVGDQAPDFSLRDFQGKEFRLADHQGKEALVLVFLRGFS